MPPLVNLFTMNIPDNINEIAMLINRDWKNKYFGAVPYLNAMSMLQSINDHYGCDSAKSIILYFLTNAKNWRGETARAVKMKLKSLCK